MLKKLLNSFYGKKNLPDPESSSGVNFQMLLDRLIDETTPKLEAGYGDAPITGCETYDQIKKLDKTDKAALLWMVAKKLSKMSRPQSGSIMFYKYLPGSERPDRAIVEECVFKTLQKLLLKEKWFMAEADFTELVQFYNEQFDKTQWYSGHPSNELVQRAAYIVDGKPPSSIMKATLSSLQVQEHLGTYNDVKRRNQKIQNLLDCNKGLPVDKHDFLGVLILSYYDSLSDERQEQWAVLLRRCFTEGSKGAPTVKWIQRVQEVRDEMKEELETCMVEWIGSCENRIREIHKQDDFAVHYLRDANLAIFKGLLWCCPTAGSPQMQQKIAEYVLIAYKKKPGVGPISMATGTAGLWNLSQLPVKEGIPRLLAVRNKISHNTILKSIDKLLREASEKNNLHPQEMEEIACPDYGMTEVGFLATELGDYKAIVREKKYQATLTFEKGGKELNSVPSAIKNEFSAELKNLKMLQKNISEQIRTHTDRLENTYLHNRQWRYDNWKNLYLDHPLLAIAGRRIIWHFNTGADKFEAIYHEGKMVQADGSPLPSVNVETLVSLWHPIGFDSGYIFQWRQWLRGHEIQQPFKQAFREVYLLTDAELRTDTYSNRYAAHIIRQHQFNALAKLRGWSYTLMGNWDGQNYPIRKLPWLDMHAEWFVQDDWEGETSYSGVLNYIMTDQVRFYKGGVLLHLHDVPALVFTELMRDVDMFVGVCSIGNDPNWQDGGNQAANHYWHQYSFSNELSASAEIRRETLQHMIPRMKIASQCSFDKKFLVVKGKLRTYKIHMGSGNILMEPNDQYLCIVPDSQPKNSQSHLYIPFEGDRLLSIIISKALLLAEDHKITDTTITRQIL